MHIGRRFLINALKSCSSSSFVKILSIVLMLIMLKIEPCLLIKNVNPVDAIKYRPILRIAREGFANFVHNDDDYLYQINMKRGKVQRQFKDDEPFFCDAKNGPGRRSNEVPTSVHKIRPGDIDIIGAMGDSLTAGNGAMALNIMQVVIENKGVSWSIGGQGTWRKYLTLPNILKEFNPNLYGYSLSDSLSFKKNARFNVAELGSMSRDTPYMAKILVKRMTADPKVDIQNHWKLITFMIGANDFCLDMCYYKVPEMVIDLHEKHLLSVLRTIRDNLPRTIVNVVNAPDVSLLLRFKGKPSDCQAIHHFECPCFFGSRFVKNRKRYIKILQKWNAIEEDVVKREEFHNRPDFTVNLQKFTNRLVFPIHKNGNTDFTYMSMDCFHLSQRGYALASNALWNNMLEPYNNKSQTWKREFYEFKCPTEEMPYITTRENSI